MRVKRPAIWLAAGAGEQALALDVDARVDERGGDALGEVLQGVGYLGAVAGGELEVVDLIDADHADPGIDRDAADGLDDVGDVRPGR